MPSHAQQFPVITDNPSLQGSYSSLVAYTLVKTADNNLKSKVNQFNANYGQRSIYLTAPLIGKIAADINSEMAGVRQRFQVIQERNSNLGLYQYGVKKKNSRLLAIVDSIILNLKNALDGQWNTNVKLGEKMNLYQNVMASINKIQRQLDVIEDTIDRSLLINQILGSY
jgi:hypothetical protein